MTGLRSLVFHGGLLVVLLALQFVLPEYHHGNFARIMVLAVYAMGFNLLFGYTGLLSLGHAMYFAAGMYGMALPIQYLGFSPAAGLASGLASALLLSLVTGFLALRTAGVAFMIVTLMFAQAVFLLILYFGEWTRGDEGIVIAPADRMPFGLDLADPASRYMAAWTLFAVVLALTLRLVDSPFGKTLVAIRENEERTRMLGYNVFSRKMVAVIASGGISGLAGAAYGMFFGYAGASFASVQYSILPLVWVLLGGAGTIAGPFIGTLFMFYLIDYASGLTSAYMLIVGAMLVTLVLFARQGIVGEIRRRFAPWLP